MPDAPHIIVLGNEGHGVRRNILSRCDVLVKLEARQFTVQGVTDAAAFPNEGHNGSGSRDVVQGVVDSLNVSVAAGILLYHFLGQHS